MIVNTVETFQTKMTLYFSKRTREIKSYINGLNDMSAFGVDAEDYSLIWDYVHLDIDENVMRNPHMFLVSEDKHIVLKPEYAPTQYPIAGGDE